MIDTLPGIVGHIFIVIAFTSALIASVGYFLSVRSKDEKEALEWKKFGRWAFYVHAASVLGVLIILYQILFGHQYEYYYAWRHSSNELPIYYLISCFWQGQEGSFLLWIFWHVVLGVLLIRVNKFWEAPLMSIFSIVQTFLVSMILGVVILDYLKLGSSPFILLREHFNADPQFIENPNAIPPDGVGLNVLLQNYWMVIHPPTLFLGFALTLVPFSYCMSGLWIKKFKDWIRPALPWTIFGGLILGIGILMGGYWAYETLSFGGYWSWDPVENAVYVPWLILIASIHTMIIYNKNNSGLRVSVILVVTTFLLILYSTFLTRSGILGNASVHSFTDLGLSGQLLTYLLTFLFLSVWIITFSWNKIPKDEKESSTYSREFWIFIGAITFALAGFQVLLTTSIPVYNTIMDNLFGIKTAVAPPSDPLAHFNLWQTIAAIMIAVLSGIGQFFWWTKGTGKEFKDKITVPLIISIMLSSLIIIYTRYFSDTELTVLYILLITTSTFTIIGNGFILFKLLKNNLKLSGGAIAHIGIGMMLLGILYSSGYSSVITKNVSGRLFTEDPTNDINAQGLLLEKNKNMPMVDYTFTYRRKVMESDVLGYIEKADIVPTEIPLNNKWIALKDFKKNGKKVFSSGDTINVDYKNEYLEVEVSDASGSYFIYPRLQDNSKVEPGMVSPSPDIKRYFTKDIYAFIAGKSKDEEAEWTGIRKLIMKPGDNIELGTITLFLEDAHVLKGQHAELTGSDSIYLASFKLIENKDTISINPVMVFKPGIVEPFKDHIDPKNPGSKLNYFHMIQKMGLNIQFLKANTDGTFTFEYTQRKPNDWIILVAMEKPLINILWIGTIILIVGFIFSVLRRYSDFKKTRNKGIE